MRSFKYDGAMGSVTIFLPCSGRSLSVERGGILEVMDNEAFALANHPEFVEVTEAPAEKATIPTTDEESDS